MFDVKSCFLMASTLVLLAAWSTRHFTSASKYCRPDLCHTMKHIACGNKNVFGSHCPSNAKKVHISGSLKQLLLNKHNEIRNRVAGGKEGKLEKACRMAKMQWDKDLANLAGMNVKKCRMYHDGCRNTEKYHYAGQNLAWIPYYGLLNGTQVLLDAIQLWYSEVSITKMFHINQFPNDYIGQQLGHFTAIVSDKNTHLGCSAVTFTESEHSDNIFLLACNYARTNIIDEPIYESCSKAGYNCKNGKDKKFKNLCKTSEKIDPNS